MRKIKPKVLKLDTPEYRIAQKQLLILEEVANNRLLTTEEAKLYDIYTKNIVLVKQNAIVEDDSNIKIEKDKIIEFPVEKLLHAVEKRDEPEKVMDISELIKNKVDNNE